MTPVLKRYNADSENTRWFFGITVASREDGGISSAEAPVAYMKEKWGWCFKCWKHGVKAICDVQT